jgi:hypothetical protein
MKKFTFSIFTYLLLATFLVLLCNSYYRPLRSSESFLFSNDSGSTNIGNNSESDDIPNASHNIHVVRDSETILLAGQIIPPKDYIHLYDSSPYKIVNGHLAVKIPCDESFQPQLNVLVGQAPNLQSISLLLIEELSKSSKLCIYHADLEETAPVMHTTPDVKIGTITDVALQNPGIRAIELPATSSVVIGVNEIHPGAEEAEH